MSRLLFFFSRTKNNYGCFSFKLVSTRKATLGLGASNLFGSSPTSRAPVFGLFRLINANATIQKMVPRGGGKTRYGGNHLNSTSVACLWRSEEHTSELQS